MKKFSFDKSDDRLRIDADRFLTNDVILPGETNPHTHKVGPWLIEGPAGPCGVVWAKHEQIALDVAANEDLLEQFAIDEEDIEERENDGGAIVYLGDTSDAFDLDNCRVRRLSWRDFPAETQEAILLAREKGVEDLSEV
jgi:hypothetical protein